MKFEPLSEGEKEMIRSNAGCSLRSAVYAYAKRTRVHGHTASRVASEYLCELHGRRETPTLFHWSPEFDAYPDVEPA
ncbi:MAG TPA: hypothetical protein VFA98_09335 [Thermoanaerobaculia bacterium]|nr:hypothetical protein [Thermoanaerobaculia bacterium]